MMVGKCQYAGTTRGRSKSLFVDVLDEVEVEEMFDRPAITDSTKDSVTLGNSFNTINMIDSTNLEESVGDVKAIRVRELKVPG